MAKNVKKKFGETNITLVLKDREGQHTIKLKSRNYFEFQDGKFFIFRCSLRNNLNTLINMKTYSDTVYKNVKVISIEIEGYNVILSQYDKLATNLNTGFELFVDPNIILTSLDVVFYPIDDTSLKILDIYCDKISYTSAYKYLLNI